MKLSGVVARDTAYFEFGQVRTWIPDKLPYFSTPSVTHNTNVYKS